MTPAAALPSRIVLVGFMAAGKTTVGRRLARRIGYRFVDLDEEVVGRAGRSIPEIFREAGEPAFRRLEAEATRALDAADRVVVAAGGGWMARPELRDRWPDAVRVWLRVEPAEAVARLGDALAGRPLLDPEDPEGAARRLLAAREEAYGRAEIAVDTGGLDADAVAGEILRRLTARRVDGGTRKGRAATSTSRKKRPRGSGARTRGAPGDPDRRHGTADADRRDGTTDTDRRDGTAGTASDTASEEEDG